MFFKSADPRASRFVWHHQRFRDVFSRAYQLGYLAAEEPWLTMIHDRNQTAHVYDENQARQIVDKIRAYHLLALEELERKLDALSG